MILHKESNDRSERELCKIAKILSRIPFFKERNLKEEYLLDIAQALWLENAQMGQRVFSYGKRKVKV